MPDIFLPFTLPESVVSVVPFCFSVCLILSHTSFARWAPTAHKTTVISISTTSQWISACERCTNQYAFFKFQADFHLHKLVHPTSRSLFLSPVPKFSCTWTLSMCSKSQPPQVISAEAAVLQLCCEALSQRC